MREELAKLATELGIANDVFFLGTLSDPRQLLDALEVFVFPSLKEGLGVALLEAMACGLPVVAARAGGIVDLVEDHRSGLLVPPRDACAIAMRSHHLRATPRSARSWVPPQELESSENFSLDAMTMKTIDLYRACLARRAADPKEANH